MYQFSPYMPPQQRLNQLEAQYPQYQQSYPQFPQSYLQPSQLLKGNFVTNFEEARASRIDLDGSLFVFPDIANKKIYTKQINLDGTAVLNTYSLESLSDEREGVENGFLTKTDIIPLLDEIKDLKEVVDEIKERVVNNAEYNASFTNVKPNKK